MTKSFAISLLAHAAALAVACVLVVETRTEPRRPGLALQVRGEETEEAERPPEPLPEPVAARAPAEAFPQEREPEPVDFDEIEYEEVAVLAVAAPRLAHRLDRPLRRREPPPPVRAAPSPPAPVRFTPVAAPPRPRGPTRGAQLVSLGEHPVEYPRAARRAGLEGRVGLRLRVGADGRVQDVRVIESSGHDMLDEAAVKAAWFWRFDPALENGRRVEGHYERVVRFHLTS